MPLSLMRWNSGLLSRSAVTIGGAVIEVIEEIAFISLSLPDQIPDELLKTDEILKIIGWLRASFKGSGEKTWLK